MARRAAAGTLPAGKKKPGAPQRAGRGQGGEFLLALGLDQATAEADAEGIEHHASEATLAAFASWPSAAAGVADGRPRLSETLRAVIVSRMA